MNAPQNMRPSAAADYLGVSQSHLAKLRMEQNRHKGPAFSKVAGCVVYRRADLDAWLEANVVQAA
ncbi:helix-turn-helix domain-containing protein [Tropicimonas aquimaris]|uniref:Helix-turn-helix domain-containing protein n=1 Tax=Tropicimonas aquimaris TaxID=914152 RepID=A0ABW3IQT0_9RHOB